MPDPRKLFAPAPLLAAALVAAPLAAACSNSTAATSEAPVEKEPAAADQAIDVPDSAPDVSEDKLTLATGRFVATGIMTDSRHRYAAAFSDGSVLFVGGETSEGSSANSEIFLLE